MDRHSERREESRRVVSSDRHPRESGELALIRVLNCARSPVARGGGTRGDRGIRRATRADGNGASTARGTVAQRRVIRRIAVGARRAFGGSVPGYGVTLTSAI